MKKTDEKYRTYINILKEELIPAMGCTEPIAIAYAAAKARETLGYMPDRIEIQASDNIIKNVKSVKVPNTGSLKGIEAAAGLVAGDPSKELEVISYVDEDKKIEIKSFLDKKIISVTKSPTDFIFDIKVIAHRGSSQASVQISHFHTNITLITKDENIIFENEGCNESVNPSSTDRSSLNIEDIIEFAKMVELNELEDLLQRQIEYNSAIAAEGIRGDWGANIGTVLLKVWGNDIKIRARAMAAAGSDARMSGCELPVVIVSGSGNQGITASVPVMEYAEELKSDKESLLRALVVSNLVTIHQKTGIGRLSAYCGAISAGVGAGAGITFLHGGGFREVAHTIVNALAIVSGIVCDGAKPSCAGKIAAAVDAGILGFHMFQKGQQFYGGEGLVRKGVENTISNIGRLGRVGMKETDKEIIKMMIEE